MILSFLQKNKDNLVPKKNKIKGNNSDITEKDDIHPRKYGISGISLFAVPY